MKITKYFLSMAAAVGMIAGCQKAEIVKISAPEDVVAPVLENIEGSIEITSANLGLESVTFNWTSADYGVKTQVNYSIEAAAAAAPDAKVVITSGLTDTTATVTYETLNAILYNDLKLADGVAEDVLFTIGAKVGEYQKIYSNAVTVSCKVTAAEKEYPKMTVVGNYQGWTPGAGQYVFDFEGTDKVYQGMIDFGADGFDHTTTEFKITGLDWGAANGEHSVPEGTEVEAEAKNIPLVSGGGSNVTAYQSKRFYHLTFDKAAPSLAADISFDQIGVIGDFNSWGADVVMEFNASKQRFYADVEFPADGGFKFRLDGAWDVAYGVEGDFLTTAGGNIPVTAGNYRVYLDMNNYGEIVYTLDAKMYGKEEPVAGTVTPEPEPEPTPELKGWGVVGTITGWADGADLMMTNDGTWYVVKGVEFGAADEFKIRLDGKWDTSFGGEFKANEEVTLTSENGPNIVPAAGVYDIYFNPETGKAWFINDGSYPGGAAAPEASEWGVVGDVNGWNPPDITMYKTATEGLFVAYNVTMPDGGFKIRANGVWNDAANYGLASSGNAEVDHAYDLVCSGSSGNIVLVAGTYDIWFDLTNSKVYVMTPGKPISEAVGGTVEAPSTDNWYLVGEFNNWTVGDTNYQMSYADGWYVCKNFTLSADGKVKFNAGSWSVNRGGTFVAANSAISVVADGPDMVVAAGTYDVYMNADADTAYFMEVGKTPAN